MNDVEPTSKGSRLQMIGGVASIYYIFDIYFFNEEKVGIYKKIRSIITRYLI